MCHPQYFCVSAVSKLASFLVLWLCAAIGEKELRSLNKLEAEELLKNKFDEEFLFLALPLVDASSSVCCFFNGGLFSKPIAE